MFKVMTNRPAVVVLLTMLVLSLSASAFAQNLLSNASFESFPASTNLGEGIYTMYDWRYFSVNGAGGRLQATTPTHDGNRALKLSRTSTAGDCGLDRDSSRVPATGGRRYRAAVWARSDTASKMLLKICAHDSSGTWLGIEASAVHPLPVDYKQCFIEFTAPAGTARLNFAIRVDGTGSIVVDDCSLIDLAVIPPSAPTITYPCNEVVDSFKPTIAFSGSPHTACQAVVTSGETVVWDSGIVNSTAYTLTCAVTLQPQTSYQVRARVQTAVGWSDYSPASEFTTPAGPLVRITTPLEADVVRTSYYTVRWVAECPSGITSQRISLDGGAWINLTASRRYRYFYSLSEGLHTVTVSSTSAYGTSTDTSTFYVQRTPTPSGTVYYYDLNYSWSIGRSTIPQARLMFDLDYAVVALQGLVNRNGPRLFVKYWNEDAKWWSRLRESEAWLSSKTVVTLPSGIDNLHILFETFRDDYQGAVLWDSDVYATSNVAGTVAGADGLIPIRYEPTAGSIYDRLVANGPRIPVVADLVGKFTGAGTIPDTGIPSTGSRKNDAYIWARTLYLETGKSNPSLLNYAVDGYWELTWPEGGIPGHALLSRDYVIRNKGFMFDLSPWDDELPVDDPTQTLGLDASTYRSILATAAARTPGMIHTIHCMPWPFKYTSWGNAGGTRHPVTMEWECTGWLSRYNAYSDADSYAYVDFPNASLYSQFPLPERLTQNRKASQTSLRKLGYVDSRNQVSPLNFLNLYIGDYDSAMWMSNVACNYWDDANRGVVPMSWAFNPNLIERAPVQYEYYNRTRTDNDSFIAGDSGAGYVNPSRLLTDRGAGLPPIGDVWIRHNLDYFRRTNTKMSGFLLNGTAGPLGQDVDSMYEQFSVDGTFSQPTWYPQGDHMSGSMPAMSQRQDLTNSAATDATIVQPMGLQGLTNFLNFRTVLIKPTYVLNLYNAVVAADKSIPWALIDAPTYGALMKSHMGVIPDNRATYTFDTIPDSVQAGQWIYAQIGVRNDGWLPWRWSGDEAVCLTMKWKQGDRVVQSAEISLSRDVPSGGGAVLSAYIRAPLVVGPCKLSYEMTRAGTGFSQLGDYAWESAVAVTAPSWGGRPAQIKAYADGLTVTVPNVVVTAGTDQFAGMFYVEDSDRTSGIRVCLDEGSAFLVREGDAITLVGTLSSECTERVLVSPSIISAAPGTPLDPLGMVGRSIGGGALNAWTPGLPGGVGTHNTGLLITAWGRVSGVDPVERCFYLNDGSTASGIRVDLGGLTPGNAVTLPNDGDYLRVTGISSRAKEDQAVVPALRPRKESDVDLRR